MFLFVQAMKSHKQPTPSLAFAEHQLLDPRQSRSNPPLSSRSSGPSRAVRARLSCCGHALERCPALGMGSHWGWELGLTHHWLLGRGSSSSRVSWEQQKGLQSQDSPEFWRLGWRQAVHEAWCPSRPSSERSIVLFWVRGRWIADSSCFCTLGLCIFALPQVLSPGWGHHKPATVSPSFALGFVLRGVKQKENRNASGWIEIKKPP